MSGEDPVLEGKSPGMEGGGGGRATRVGVFVGCESSPGVVEVLSILQASPPLTHNPDSLLVSLAMSIIYEYEILRLGRRQCRS